MTILVYDLETRKSFPSLCQKLYTLVCANQDKRCAGGNFYLVTTNYGQNSDNEGPIPDYKACSGPLFWPQINKKKPFGK